MSDFLGTIGFICIGVTMMIGIIALVRYAFFGGHGDDEPARTSFDFQATEASSPMFLMTAGGTKLRVRSGSGEIVAPEGDVVATRPVLPGFTYRASWSWDVKTGELLEAKIQKVEKEWYW